MDVDNLIQSGDILPIIPKVFGTNKNPKKKKDIVKIIKGVSISNLTILHAYTHIKQLYDYHNIIVDEIVGRGYPHFYTDDLDATNYTPEDLEEPSGEYVSLEDVIMAFPTALSVDGESWVSYLSGGIVKDGKIPKNHKVDLIVKHSPDHRLVIAFKTMKPKWLADIINPIFDESSELRDDMMPIGKYGIFKTSKKEQSSDLSNEVKPFLNFSHLTAKLSFDDIYEFYNTWARKYLDRGIILQKNYDGIRFSIHKNGDKVRIFSENGSDRTEDMPNVVKELKESKIDSFVLDATMVAYDTSSKDVKTACLRSKGKPIPIEDTKWALEGDITTEQEASMVFHVNDVLYFKGESLSNEPYYTPEGRFAILVQGMLSPKNRFFTVARSSFIIDNKDINPSGLIREINELFNHTNSIVAKVSDSVYPIISGKVNKTEEWCELSNVRDLTLKFEECPHYKNDWCPIRSTLLSDSDLPVVCKIANIYKCHYLNDMYYR